MSLAGTYLIHQVALILIFSYSQLCKIQSPRPAMFSPSSHSKGVSGNVTAFRRMYTNGTSIDATEPNSSANIIIYISDNFYISKIVMVILGWGPWCSG